MSPMSNMLHCDRRGMIAAGVTTAGLIGAVGPTLMRAKPWAKGFVLYDERYSDSRLFAQASQVAGYQPLASTGDISEILRDRDTASSIVALLTEGDQEVARLLAPRTGWRFEFVGRHDARSGTLRHELTWDAGRHKSLTLKTASWPIALARTLTLGNAHDRDALATPDARKSLDNPGYLVSWRLRRA